MAAFLFVTFALKCQYMLHVSLHAEPIFRLLGISVSNSLLSSWIVVVGLLLFAALVGRSLKRIPMALQSAVELTYTAFTGIAESVIANPRAAAEAVPVAITLFAYIVFSNLIGLIPGVGTVIVRGADSAPLFRAPTSDLNTTVCLALITVGFVQYMGVKHLGGRQYLSKFFTLKSPLDTMVGFQELISEITRIVSFSFRLFGNIFAGELIISVILFLTSTYLPFISILPLPFYTLELGFALIQAYVFAFLMLIFTGLAITSHGSEAHGEELAVA